MKKEVKLSRSQMMGLQPYMQQMQAATGQVNTYFGTILEEQGEDPKLPWQFTEQGSLVVEIPDVIS